MKSKEASCTLTTLGKVCYGLGITLAKFFSHPYFKLKVVGKSLVGEI